MKLIKLFFTLTALIILGSVVFATYMGFVPVLSSVFGANKPKDLGVKYSTKEYNDFSNKTNGDIIPITEKVDASKSISYLGKKEVNDSFSQEIISARLNYGKWKYMPVGNTQVRINPDGSVEFSGNILMNHLSGFIAREGMGKWTMTDVIKGLEFIKLIKVNPPVYAKFTPSIINNKLSLSIQNIQVGKFNVPLGTINANETIVSVYESIVSKASGYFAKLVTFSDGKMNFEGTIPEKMMVEVAN